MPITEEPMPASEVAAFGAAANRAAAINYSVPLPAVYTIPHVVPLRFPPDCFTDEARTTGTSLKAMLGAAEGAEGDLDWQSVRRWFDKLVPLAASPGPQLFSRVLPSPAPVPPVLPPSPHDASVPTETEATRSVPAAQNETGRNSFLDALIEKQRSTSQGLAGVLPATIDLPAAGIGKSLRLIPVPVEQRAVPTIAVVETYLLSSFLGDYGLGRTLQTFSLLPGEQTTISMETWRTDSVNVQDSTSVFESSDTAAQTRFTSELSQETGTASQEEGTWTSSLATTTDAGAGFLGFVRADFDAATYDAASSQNARQQFSNSVSRAASEHASQVNNSRQQSVQNARVIDGQSGASTSTVRTIANTNLRRVLNFVFRELNQTYETITSLRDVQVAFYNGNPGSFHMVAMSDMRELLERFVVPERRDDVARKILGATVECVDHEGNAKPILQRGTRQGGMFEWRFAELSDEGELYFDGGPLERKYSWRIAPGPIGQDGQEHMVPGVVTQRQSVVLRTDNIVVEALLGQADALDPYASKLQTLDLASREADITHRLAETTRLEKALALIDGQAADKRVEAWNTVLGEKPEIQVIPVAAANGGSPS